MLNVSGKDQTLRHDMHIGVTTPCQTDYVSMATDADMRCVSARQCGVDAIDMTINMARWSDCQTVSTFDCLLARDGPLVAQKGLPSEPSGLPASPVGLQAGLAEPRAGRDGLAVRDGPMAGREGLAVRDGPLADRDGPAGRDS